MKFQLLFLILVMSSLGLNVNNSSSGSSRLIDLLQDLCPDANICRQNQTTQAPLKKFLPGHGPCCTACSCAPDCEGDGNCCFPRSEPQQQSDGTASQTKTVCLFTTTAQPRIENVYQSFYMITSVSNNPVDDIKSITNSSCGDENVAPWGSLYPVYSAKRKQIYKNMACAANDGVEDGKLWDAELTCSTVVDSISLDASSNVLGLNSNFIQDNCQVNFIFQGDSKDIRPLTCYVDPVDICEASEFQMPDGIDASKEEIIEACTSGLVSPYVDEKLYANVFCHICNAAMFKKDRLCKARIDPGARSSVSRGFTGLIDGSFIAESRLGYLEGAPKQPRACTIQAVNKLINAHCRTVFCPSGQLRDRAGKCRYLHKLWYSHQHSIYINLTAEEYININEVFRIKPGDITSTLPNFYIPWRNNWFIESVFYADVSKNNNVTLLLVILRNKLSKVQPHRFVQDIKKMVIRNWLLRYNNVTTVFNSNFIKYRQMRLVRLENSKLFFVFGNHSVRLPKPRYHKIYSNTLSPANKHSIITKLYLCEQVELTETEYILSQDKVVLYNTITKQFLFDLEFTMIMDQSFKGVGGARICLDDSGMYSPDQLEVSFSDGGSLFKSRSVWPLVLTLLFLIFSY